MSESARQPWLAVGASVVTKLSSGGEIVGERAHRAHEVVRPAGHRAAAAERRGVGR